MSKERWGGGGGGGEKKEGNEKGLKKEPKEKINLVQFEPLI